MNLELVIVMKNDNKIKPTAGSKQAETETAIRRSQKEKTQLKKHSIKNRQKTKFRIHKKNKQIVNNLRRRLEKIYRLAPPLP